VDEPCPEWREEDSERPEEQRRLIQQRLQSVLEGIIKRERTQFPTAELVCSWHKGIFGQLVPVPYYAGGFRNDNPKEPCLQGYDVEVGSISGAPSKEVLPRVETFFKEFQSKVRELDQATQQGSHFGASEIDELASLAAWAHGEWVRIHPFANGNGRTARLLTNYVFIRYNFGPVPILRLRPRPDQPYARAAALSMASGNHVLMKRLLLDLLEEVLRGSD
jgi:fido (protein-threonine AMPylation protein)